MSFDRTAYRALEQLFRDQVEQDRPYAEGWGVYLPNEEPKSSVDYILVGMEPSFQWAKTIEDAEKKIAGGFRNGAPARFTQSIERFLCQPGQTYHLTDISKGAMPVKAAALNRELRYEGWFLLLLEEIEIVGKPGAPVIAIGKKVEAYLQRRDLTSITGRPLYRVPHYSYLASAYFKGEAEKDPEGFEAFRKSEYGGNSPIAKERQVFVYKGRFEEIRARLCCGIRAKSR